ncbi:hypothetical protein N2152v2_007904 [Parachlorella kessleri]
MAKHFTVLALLFVVGIAAAQSDCPNGFTGPECALCTSDAGCADLTGYADATCNTDLSFSANSELKNFHCTIESSTFSAFIVPDSLLIQCYPQGMNMTMDSVADAPAGPFCTLSMTLQKTLGNSVVNCIAEDCDFTTGSAKAQCQKTSCACTPADCGSSTVSGLIGQLKGTVGVDCQQDGTCGLTLEGLPLASGPVNVKCDAAECLVD